MRLPMVIAVQHDLQREACVEVPLRRRLEVLRKAFATGQSRLREVERQPVSIRETLLQLSGARQVIEEVLAETPPEARAPRHREMPLTAVPLITDDTPRHVGSHLPMGCASKADTGTHALFVQGTAPFIAPRPVLSRY